MQKKDVLEEVQTERIHREGVYCDFCDAEFVRKHPMYDRNKEVLLLGLYYDDLEVVNPLGSKRGKHKLGMSVLQLSAISLLITKFNIHVSRCFLLDVTECTPSITVVLALYSTSCGFKKDLYERLWN